MCDSTPQILKGPVRCKQFSKIVGHGTQGSFVTIVHTVAVVIVCFVRYNEWHFLVANLEFVVQLVSTKKNSSTDASYYTSEQNRRKSG